MASAAPILYVEDEEYDVFFMQLAFQRAHVGHRLKAVPDGAQAIEYLAGAGPFADREHYPLPSLVLLDLNLPLKSGMQVLEWIRSQEQFKSLPVVIYSSSGQPRDQERAEELGVTDYVVKRSNVEQLTQLLENSMERWLEGRAMEEHRGK